MKIIETLKKGLILNPVLEGNSSYQMYVGSEASTVLAQLPAQTITLEYDIELVRVSPEDLGLTPESQKSDCLNKVRAGFEGLQIIPDELVSGVVKILATGVMTKDERFFSLGMEPKNEGKDWSGKPFPSILNINLLVPDPFTEDKSGPSISGDWACRNNFCDFVFMRIAKF